MITKRNRTVERCINVKKVTPLTKSRSSQPFTWRGSDYKPTAMFEIIVIVTILVQTYLYYKYVNDPTTVIAGFTVLNIIFCVVGRYVWGGILQGLDLVGAHPWERLPYIDETGKTKKPLPVIVDYRVTGGWDIVIGIGLFGILVIIQSLIRLVKLNVTPTDAFLFYLFSAPAEEAFFRFFLTAAPIVIGLKIISWFEHKCPGEDITTWKEFALKSSVATITGLIFGLAHEQKYTGGVLLGVILDGLVLSFVYAFTKRIDIVLIAHLLVNFASSWMILVGLAPVV